MRKQQPPRRMDARIYRYWQALYMAFYSQRLYVDVVKRWRGFCFFYLLLLIAIASIPFSIRLMHDFNRYFNEDILAPIEKIPLLQIHNGVVFFDKPMPYFIKNKAGSVVVMIDTRDSVKGMDVGYPDLMILVTKNQFYWRVPTIKLFLNQVKTPVEKPTIITLDKHYSYDFVAKTWVKTRGVLTLKWFAMLMIYPMIISFILGLALIFLLAFSMLGQVFSWLILRFKLQFKEAVRLLIVASTAQAFVFFALLAFDLLFKEFCVLFLVLTPLYFSYGVLSVKRESKQLVYA